MLDVNALMGEAVRNGYNKSDLANALGMCPKTFRSRLKTGNFGSKEIEVLIDLLHIEDPMPIFFCTISNL